MAQTLRSEIADFLKAKGFEVVQVVDLEAAKQGAIKNDFIYLYRAAAIAKPNNSMCREVNQLIKNVFHLLLASKNQRDVEDANELKSLDIRKVLLGHTFGTDKNILNYVGGKNIFIRNQALWLDEYEIEQNEHYQYSTN